MVLPWYIFCDFITLTHADIGVLDGDFHTWTGQIHLGHRPSRADSSAADAGSRMLDGRSQQLRECAICRHFCMGMDEAASCGFEVIDSVFLCYGCRRGTGMLEALPKPEKLVVRTRVPVSKYVVVFQPHDVAA